MDPVDALHGLGGAATWQSLHRAGVTRHALWRRRVDGSVQHVRRGVYALPGAPADLVRALRLGGLLAGASAALHHGFPLLEAPAQPVVAVPRAWSHCTGPGVLRVDLPPADRGEAATTPLRTVLDCARRLPVRAGLVVADAAVRGGVELAALLGAAAASRGPGADRIRVVARHVDPRAESPVETCIRWELIELGLPFDCQVQVPWVGSVNLVVDGWLVLEGDGFAYHSDRDSYRRDRRRWSLLTAQGYGSLVLAYEDVVHRPEWVQQLVSASLSTASRRPPQPRRAA